MTRGLLLSLLTGFFFNAAALHKVGLFTSPTMSNIDENFTVNTGNDTIGITGGKSYRISLGAYHEYVFNDYLVLHSEIKYLLAGTRAQASINQVEPLLLFRHLDYLALPVLFSLRLPVKDYFFGLRLGPAAAWLLNQQNTEDSRASVNPVSSKFTVKNLFFDVFFETEVDQLHLFLQLRHFFLFRHNNTASNVEGVTFMIGLGHSFRNQ